MLVKQLSVFLENKSGRLNHLTKALGENGVNILTLSIADTMDFGIVRFITRDNDKALKVLKSAGFTVSQTELIGVEVGDKPGALNETLDILEKNNIGVEYLYSFVLSDSHTAKILFKVADNNKAVSVLKKNNVKLLSEMIL